MSKPNLVIIGAGPAGLTAAYELSLENKYNIIVLEGNSDVGGISKTVNYKGNLIDIGGHRFFSKSERVLHWWAKFLPIVDTDKHQEITYHSQKFSLDKIIEQKSEEAFLIRPRKSRIYFSKRLFDYPLKVNYALIKNLGKKRSLRIARDIILANIKPIKPEKSLEDFYINRFGKELYKTFFRDYTKKVWGKDCKEISSEWGRQRVKTLGIPQILWHSVKNFLSLNKHFNTKSERSLIEKFLYPAKGPGQLWSKVKDVCEENGVKFILNAHVIELKSKGDSISEVVYNSFGVRETIKADTVFSTMPLKHLIRAMSSSTNEAVNNVADKLEYRDFLIVGILLTKLKFEPFKGETIKDNWLYIQDKGVQVGRLQIFNNWSPNMVVGDNFWIGAEYFCNKGDDLWQKTDQELIDLALNELEQIGVLDQTDFLDAHVVKCPKAYPSYTGSYDQIDIVKDYLETIDNLYPMGRNGLHKYNNQDHSMLTAFKAVELFERNISSKQEIWEINSDDEYHEKMVSKNKFKEKIKNVKKNLTLGQKVS